MIARTAAAAIAVVALLGGCGRPANCPPSSAGPAPAQPAPAQPAPAKTGYGFGLPKGDRSVDQTVEGEVYQQLAQSRCAQAGQLIDDAWTNFGEPRGVVLFQAAVDLCAGRTTAARQWYDTVAKGQGWRGVGWESLDPERGRRTVLNWHVCAVYQATASALLQQAKEDLPCTYNSPDQWSESDPELRKDPRKALSR